MKDFHCCATCRHFKAEKKLEGMHYFCSRLGFGTKKRTTNLIAGVREKILRK